MAQFVSKTPIRVMVDEYPDEYIAIKPKMSLGDRNKLTGAMIEYQGEAMAMRVDKYLQVMLEVAIVGWHLYERDVDNEFVLDDKGEKKEVPFKKELIYEFDDADPLVDKVLAEIAERNPSLGGTGAGPMQPS